MKNQKEIKINLCPLDPLGVPLYLREEDDPISAFNLACDFCRKHEYNSWRMSTCALYLLRAEETQAHDLLFALLEVGKLPEVLLEVIYAVSFYNQHGREIYPLAKKRREGYQQFVLRSLAQDCEVTTTATADFISGYGQRHVWIAERYSNRRVLLIHF